MKTKSLILCAILTLLTANAGAVEIKNAIKGSFKEYYPNASVVANTIMNTVIKTGAFEKDFIKVVQDERDRATGGFSQYAIEYCNGKSAYATVDNFVAQTTFDNKGALLIVTDANIICFNLAKK